MEWIILLLILLIALLAALLWVVWSREGIGVEWPSLPPVLTGLWRRGLVAPVVPGWLEGFSVTHPHWVAHRKLGSGGVGNVFQVEDRAGSRWLAIKILKLGYCQHAQMRLRFMDEAALLMRCAQVNASPSIHAMSLQDAPRPWFAMDMLVGYEPISGWCNTRVSARARRRIARAMATAVAHMHAMGVIHRDLCPNNMMVKYGLADNPFGADVKVIDFGSATLKERNMGGAKLLHNETQVGWFAGKYIYAAPELIRSGMKDATAAADVFSLGVVLYELLAGQSLPATKLGGVDMDVLNRAAVVQRLKEGAGLSSVQADGVWDILRQPPSARPSARDVCLWFSGD